MIYLPLAVLDYLGPLRRLLAERRRPTKADFQPGSSAFLPAAHLIFRLHHALERKLRHRPTILD